MKDNLLHQLVFLLEPIGLVWLGLLMLTGWLLFRRQWKPALLAGLIVLFVTIIGSTGVSGSLLRSLEQPYAGVKIDTLPPAEAIVLLGGGAAPSRYEAEGVHLTAAGDRLAMAHALYRRGKAPTLLLGGNANKLDGVVKFEGVIVRDLLATWGTPPDAIIPLGANEDTHDEALKVRAIATERGWHRVLLVTSANHMRRAAAVFRAQGLEVIPAPCNFLTTVATAPPPPGVSVPRYDGFMKVAIWLHEKVGWWTYRHRGWIAADGA
ncbi:MAG: YdcF family protein [Chthoniobacter sp.]|uniref:YdcF family protein n=1 Tax=Chthoniobacter sp. TaxID=2510640 RepID=UPI0032AD0E44